MAYTRNEKEVKATNDFLRISPQRMRLVVDVVKKRGTEEAVAVLESMPHKGARFIVKVLKSAIANAKQKGLDESKLIVSNILADKGPTLKRIQPRAMGRADSKLRRTTNLSVFVREGSKVVNARAYLAQQEEAKNKKKPSKKAAKAS